MDNERSQARLASVLIEAEPVVVNEQASGPAVILVEGTNS